MCIKVWGFITVFLNIPRKRDNLVSLRPNYFIFIGYSSEQHEPPLDPPLGSNKLLLATCVNFSHNYLLFHTFTDQL